MPWNAQGISMHLKETLILVTLAICLQLVFVAPLVVGEYVGHGWGGWAAVVNVAGWLYGGFRMSMAPTTRLIWLFDLMILIFLSIHEFQHP